MRQGGLKESSPVFVIGSYRSGTSVLTWALGQHPNLFPLEETHFLYKLAVDVDNLYQLGIAPGDRSFLGQAAYTRREFRHWFGGTFDAMVRAARPRIARRSREAAANDPLHVSDNIKLRRGWWQPKRRWVDGTPENSHFVLPILRLFPNARFIHILRNPRRVATSLMHFSTVGATDYAQDDAYHTWIRLAKSSALAEQAFGPQRVMRLAHEDLVSSPREALARCLAFAGEKYHADCLKPLAERMNSSRYADVGDCSIETNLHSPVASIREAFELYAQLTAGKPVMDAAPDAALRILQHGLTEYQESLLPEVNENLTRENGVLRARLSQLASECAALKRSAGCSSALPPILEWGPDDIRAGSIFNPQPGGDNAIWVRTNNASPDTYIVLAEQTLETKVSPDGKLLTAPVPKPITAEPGKLPMYLRSGGSGDTSPPVTVTIAP